MAESNRTRILAGLLGASLLAALLLDQQSWLVAPFRARSERMQQLLVQKGEQWQVMKRHQRQQDDLRRWSDLSLPHDESLAAALYYPYLTSMAQDSGLKQVTITPGSAGEEDADARWMVVTLSAEATTTEWADFFQRFKHTQLLQRISRWDLQPAGDRLLRGSLALEVACIRGRQVDEQPKARLPESLAASLLGSQDWFGNRATPATPATPLAQQPIAEETPAIEEPATPAQPAAPPLILVGTWISSSRQEAWFYEADSGTSMVLSRDLQGSPPSQQAALVSVDRASATVRIDGKEVRIGLGQQLPDGDNLGLTAAQPHEP